jgi:hypothetical protein
MDVWQRAVAGMRELGDPQGLFPSLAVGVAYAARTGARSLALSLADELEELGREHPLFLGTSLIDAGRGLISIGAPDRLEALLGIARGGDPWVDVLLGACRGLLAEQNGSLEEAVSLYRQVWEFGEPLGQRFEPTRARIDAARCLRALGRVDEAAALLADALDAANAMGADLLADEITEADEIDSAAGA